MQRVEDQLMETARRSAADLLDVARVLLLVQGSILIATTIEALIWSFAFGGAAGTPVAISGAAAAAILVARARLRGDRRWPRRLVFIVEGVILATLALDTVLAIALTGALPPAVALLTRLLLPISVMVLLRRASDARPTPASIRPVTTFEGA
jgi:hypothetical protein